MRYKNFTLIEVLILIAVLIFAVSSFLSLRILYVKANQSAKNQEKAVFLAKEILEAVQNLKNSGWNNYIAVLNSGTNYYLTQSGSSWALTTINPGLIDNMFTRYVVFSDVYRDAADNITENGTLDNLTKKVKAVVQWTEREQIKKIEIETYITKWRE